MKTIPKPTNHISPKAKSVWRIHDLIYYMILLLFLSVLLITSAYYHWFDWARITLYIIFVLITLQAIYKLTLHPILLHKSWHYRINQDYVQTMYGFFHTSLTTIPMSRVEYVHTNDGPILRKFGLMEMTIGTMTTSVKIPALLRSEARYLQKNIMYFAKLKELIEMDEQDE